MATVALGSRASVVRLAIGRFNRSNVFVHRSSPWRLLSATAAAHQSSDRVQRPIKRIMAANRGEIAVRIFRAATEMEIETVAIYSKEDSHAVHRYKADQAFLVAPDKGPVAAYLSIPDIVRIAVDHKVDAIHPGYGFLSESPELVEACDEAGIMFIGPTARQLHAFGDKTQARKLAIESGLPILGGTPGAVTSVEEARHYIEGEGGSGYPIIIKASRGGGGRGMRVVTDPKQLEEAFERCSSEALASFGDASVFVERFIPRPRHIEVQVLGDGTDVVHLYERDCSVQRRHQKVVEFAPAMNLPDNIRAKLYEDAVNIAKSVNYFCAGTVEFLYDPATQEHFFIEVNPRIQVEHTVTEQLTGVDLVQAQIRLASGKSLPELGLAQDNIKQQCSAIQVRVTTEDPLHSFAPDTGRIDVWRPAGGFGIRLDSGSLHTGAHVLPYYDSMLAKVTSSGRTFEEAARRLTRALKESRVRGVKTNIPFLLNVIRHPEFLSGEATTRFIEEHPDLMSFEGRQNRAGRLLNYLGDLIVNGRSVAGAVGPDPDPIDCIMPAKEHTSPATVGWRNILRQQGPQAFADAVRKHPTPLLTDTTWRDAHQSLLATRVRTNDILRIAKPTSHALQGFYSLENWGGATFDVAMRFLHECPWDRLERMREQVPNIPFQMLLRGANAVGYTNYPDNVINKFCQVAKDKGMDVFRVFDSLNYEDNLRIGIAAAGAAGGVVEGAICYTGDLSNPKKTKYTLDYYLELARLVVGCGAHVLCIKDMAGLLNPKSTKKLISALRREHPDVPIHVHTHDTSGLGVASMVAAIEAGADVVDGAVDSMSGMTSQPSLGALVAHFRGTATPFDVNPSELNELSEYWESVRAMYSPFESGQKSGSADVYEHEIPGGQYTNLHFQAYSLGLADKWRAIKKAYAAANRLCGDIVKVTPSSKVVGDLAQFMVQNNLTEEDVLERAETLSFPTSVIDFFRGAIGQPLGGFPEPLRSRITKGRDHIDGRPGADMQPMDLERLRQDLHKQHSPEGVSDRPDLAEHYVTDTDLMSAAMYPKEYKEYRQFVRDFGDVTKLPTRNFIAPMKPGEEIEIELETGKNLLIKFEALGPYDEEGKRQVFFNVNGVPRSIYVPDRTRQQEGFKPKSVVLATDEPGSIGAPMPGAVVDVKVRVGDVVEKGQACIVLNAMKMETVVTAPFSGVVKAVNVGDGATVAAQELLFEVEPAYE